MKNILLIYDFDDNWSDSEKKEVSDSVIFLEHSLIENNYSIELLKITGNNLAEKINHFDNNKYLVFNCCESIPGIQHSESLVVEFLENNGFTYTGATSEVLKICEDKVHTKKILESNNIPTPLSKIFNKGDVFEWHIFPAIVKCANEHCSLDITPESVVQNACELKNQLNKFFKKFDQPALVESFIDGREFHVSLWGNKTIDILPIAEMDFSAFNDIQDRLCTFDSKFVPTSKHYNQIQTLLPAPLSESDYSTISAAAKKSYSALNCRDYGRIDLRLKNGIPFVLDVNPNPDISNDTSMVLAAELCGFSYGKFCSKIIDFALTRFNGNVLKQH
jgi:D-alanine-D-alanine ligase